MVSKPSVIPGPYFEDILDQPQSLTVTLAGLRRGAELEQLAALFRQRAFYRVVLTGMGSSYHGLHPLNLKLIANGYTCLMVETSELIHYQTRLFDPKTLIIAVSQSGRSAEVIRLLEVNEDRSPVIAVTNTPDSPLAQRADAVVATRAGEEFSVSCKTYVTALMALHWLGDVLCGVDAEDTRSTLEQVPQLFETYIRGWQLHVDELAYKLRAAQHVFLVGRGDSMAAVGTGALIVKESDHFHAEGMSSAAFRHGPLEMLNGNTFVAVFSGDSKTRLLNERLLKDIREQGVNSELVSEDSVSPAFRLPRCAPGIRPILEILPVQMMTLALAAQQGREAGRFEVASKVTTTE